MKVGQIEPNIERTSDNSCHMLRGIERKIWEGQGLVGEAATIGNWNMLFGCHK